MASLDGRPKAKQTLQEKLQTPRYAALAGRSTRVAYLSVLRLIQESRLVDRVRNVGKYLEPFVLPNTSSEPVSSEDLLTRGPLVITFFRGGWCPYCVLALCALQECLHEIEGLGGTLVAIGPETQEYQRNTKVKLGLTYDLLTDEGLTFSSSMGLTFVAPPEVKKLLNSVRIDLAVRHGSSSWLLPMPVTYVVDRSGRICYAYTDDDFTKRAKPEHIVSAVRVVATF